MKYIFFGTPRFASIVLAGLLDAAPPLAVVANPDRPAGRKKVMTPPAVKALLQEKAPGIELLQPENLSSIAPRLKALAPDFFVVAAYGKIIPADILNIARLGTIGVHPSLLPRYRGATPIQSAILGGEAETGVTLYLMDPEVDHGPILAADQLAIGAMAYPELEAALAALGGRLLAATMPDFADGVVTPRTQEESRATFTKKFSTEDGFIPWEDLVRAAGAASGEGGAEGQGKADASAARAAWQNIRAFDPEPGAWTLKGGLRIKLLSADLREGKLVLREIQRAGKNPEAVKGLLP